MAIHHRKWSTITSPIINLIAPCASNLESFLYKVPFPLRWNKALITGKTGTVMGAMGDDGKPFCLIGSGRWAHDVGTNLGRTDKDPWPAWNLGLWIENSEYPGLPSHHIASTPIPAMVFLQGDSGSRTTWIYHGTSRSILQTNHPCLLWRVYHPWCWDTTSSVTDSFGPRFCSLDDSAIWLLYLKALTVYSTCYLRLWQNKSPGSICGKSSLLFTFYLFCLMSRRFIKHLSTFSCTENFPSPSGQFGPLQRHHLLTKKVHVIHCLTLQTIAKPV